MQKRIWTGSALTVGFALGGFFDGVLLHQILQWHHLLSLVEATSTLRQQILWDGYFHAAMYLLAVVGVVGLWVARRQASSGMALIGCLLMGFGLWHTVDAVLAHWLLGLHRIRVDSAFPLLWDLAWLTIFGLLPLAFGWGLSQSGSGGGNQAQGRRPVLYLALLATFMGGWAARPPADMPLTAIVFRADLSPDHVTEVLRGAGATLVWAEPRMSVVLVDMDHGQRLDLYRQGALLVGGSGLPAGCFSWSRA